MIRQLILCASLGVVVLACDSTATTDEDRSLVVQAFLYADEPVDDVYLTLTIPFGEEAETPEAVDDATIALLKNGQRYALAPMPDEPGRYHYAGDDLAVKEGDTFNLEVEASGQVLLASTTVPAPPIALATTGPELKVPNFDSNGRPVGGIDGLSDVYSVTWTNNSEDYHYVVLESMIELDPEYILPDFIRSFFDGFEIVTEPTRANYFDVRPISLEVMGAHRVTVYRVNNEYADLYDNQDQDSRDLNEPPTNIEGGLGLFTAFNGASTTFNVVRE
ncbi:MAG: hypothetical protein RhofKO_22660 [Rhodothermales bacterium]